MRINVRQIKFSWNNFTVLHNRNNILCFPSFRCWEVIELVVFTFSYSRIRSVDCITNDDHEILLYRTNIYILVKQRLLCIGCVCVFGAFIVR